MCLGVTMCADSVDTSTSVDGTSRSG